MHTPLLVVSRCSSMALMAFSFTRNRRKKSSFVDTIFGFIESQTPSDRLLLKLSLLVFFVSLGFYLLSINKQFLTQVPHNGGTLAEGIVGTPRFVNPLLAVTPADKDIAALVYSGIMKLGPDGTLVNDMADSITVADDGLTYNIVLKQGLTFHDGTPVTADDVMFTVSRIEDPLLKSPLLASWEGVTLERVGDHELNMVLQKPYAPFMENLTLGILPKHIWEDASADAFPFSQYNSEPIGSGPYKVERIVRSKSGIPDSYLMSSFAKYAGGTPKIENVKLVFYSNESALVDDFKKGVVTSVAGLSPHSIKALGDISATYNTYTVPLPRTFAVFLNQNEAPLFRDKVVRQVLSMMTNRTPIIQDVLGGYGYGINGPTPPLNASSSILSAAPDESTADLARGMLREDGWKFDDASRRWKKKLNDVETELVFHLATANTDILERTAEALKTQWEAIGVVVEVEKFEQVDLTQTIIRPRKYDALLFGTVIGRELDFYPFWHSSQRNDPGLNVALYANITTDAILGEARTTMSHEERLKKNDEFALEISKDVPAIFLYAPAFTYIVPNNVQKVRMEGIAEPYERFAALSDWYIDTESVWPLFQKK